MTDDVKIEVVPANDSPTVWRSMCLTMDKNAVQYFTTIGIITGIMGFSIYKLSTNESCESQTAYMGLLTMMIGLVAPAPQFKK
jgi:hypothetical protein